MTSYFDSWIVIVEKSSSERTLVRRDELNDHLEYSNLSLYDVDVLPVTEVNADELAEAASLEFENANYHELVQLPSAIVKNLREADISEVDILTILKTGCFQLHTRVRFHL